MKGRTVLLIALGGLSAEGLIALPPYAVPFEIVASPLYSAAWILSIICGTVAVGRISLLALSTGSVHLRSLAGVFAAFLMAVICAYFTELNRLGSVDENLARIATMAFLCFIPILAPRVAETLPGFPFRLRLSRVLTACGFAMLFHYLVSGAVFYALEFRGGAGRYFDGHRVLPAFALYVLLSLAGIYTGLVFLAARDHLSAVERVSLRRFALCCIGFAPPMLAVDELRFLIPPLWNLYPREDLFVLPFFFAATSLAALGYARSHSRGALIPVAVAGAGHPFEPFALSQREREVAELLSQGLAYKEVSYRLGISMGTTQSHVASVYRKLGVNCKEDLMLLYSRSKASVPTR